ncbi:class I adenylate-forming enzyme family protein [Phreatobacter stygius]|uniref:Long-chain fatty acid--CoA ligase n=1 Tax=Phreatobacter stygius TaxID=1940610 RepID=A0A4D7BB52_9HYPH|nr:AMP-binding protein [Phreatobacter stygius]QCI67870.1 long-chain fatty acid--CoA ligase [Phreatobacter stygius]
MAWLDGSSILIRREAHFGDRVIACFAERPAGLFAMFVDAVDRNPTGEAVVCGEERLSYRTLDAKVATLAAALAGRGIGVGDRVALLVGNRSEFVTILLAVMRLGAIAVPMGIRLQTPEIAYVLEDCGARLLIHEADLTDRLPAAAEVPRLEARIATGAGFAALLASGEGRAAGPAATTGEEETAVILYTSGTTGRPKGAMLTHLNIVHSAMVYAYCMNLGTDDRSAAAVPLSHVTGLIANVAAMLRAAGTLVIVPVFKAADYLDLSARERVTQTILVPAMYNLCLMQPDFDRYDLSSWRIGGYGGAPMPTPTIEKLAEKLPGLKLINAYGATETTSPTTMMPPEFTASRGDSVGFAVPCAEVIVVDEAGREVPAGETGEIWIRGPSVVKGYWNNPVATAAGFTGGYWHSGDIGAIDAQGFIQVLDRKKDMINRGGYKIFTAEVETVLVAADGVIECAVVAVPCPVLGERVHAFVVTDPALSPTVEALKRYCAERLSDYKVPESLTLTTDPLPRNANGKVIKRALREALKG